MCFSGPPASSDPRRSETKAPLAHPPTLMQTSPKSHTSGSCPAEENLTCRGSEC